MPQGKPLAPHPHDNRNDGALPVVNSDVQTIAKTFSFHRGVRKSFFAATCCEIRSACRVSASSAVTFASF